jgi:tetratricopeptide (TPR) repeat protein
MRKFCCSLLFLVLAAMVSAQNSAIDSLQSILRHSKEDSNRVTALWRLAEQYQFFKPDTTLQLAQQALLLSQRIRYLEGESRSLAVMATGQYLLGDYPKALNNYMLKLQLEEKRNSSRNYASALNNIGLMYILLAEYPNALNYLHRADSTVRVADGKTKAELENRILVNLG